MSSAPGASWSAAGDATKDPTAPGTPGPAESWWGESPPRAIAGTALVALGATVAAGVALGLLWLGLAPAVEATYGARPTEAQLDRIFGAEAVFAAVMTVAGVASAALGRGWLRRAGPFAVVGLVVAGLVGSIVAWRVGVWAGPDPVESLTELTAGDAVRLPLVLRSYGLLLVWPIAASFVTLWIATLSTAPGTTATTST